MDSALCASSLAMVVLLALTTTTAFATEDYSPPPDLSQWAPGEGIVTLPPFLVEDDVGQPWLVAKLDGIEVLSRTSREMTKNLIDRHQRLLAMLSIILPEQLQPKRDVPMVLVLSDTRQQTATTRELTNRLQQGMLMREMGAPVRFMPNFNFWDLDSQVIYFPLDEFTNDQSAITVTPAYLRYLLETRTPALPRWFIEGMVALHDTLVLPVPSMARQLFGTKVDAPATARYYPFDMVTVEPFVWQTEEKTKEMHNLVKQSARSRGVAYLPDSFPFLPLQRMFQIQSLDTLDQAESEILSYQAALFIRWALDPDPQELRLRGAVDNVGKPSVRALWDFVARSATEPFSDQLFVHCFGKSIEEIDGRLRGYLPFACLKTAGFKLKPAKSPSIQDADITLATPLDISQLRGRLERLQVVYVSARYPKLTSTYAERAQRTLHRAYKLGDYNAKLLAEMGLCEVDAGDDTAARPFLAAAAQAKVVHPRVYLELARIDYAPLVELDPELSDTTDQIAKIESLLETGFAQNPALAGSYQLLFEIWLRRNATLTASQLARLDEGATLFPRDYRVVYAAALLHITHSQNTEARQLIERSLPFFPTAEQHLRLTNLQQMLTTNPVN